MTTSRSAAMSSWLIKSTCLPHAAANSSTNRHTSCRMEPTDQLVAQRRALRIAPSSNPARRAAFTEPAQVETKPAIASWAAGRSREVCGADAAVRRGHERRRPRRDAHLRQASVRVQCERDHRRGGRGSTTAAVALRRRDTPHGLHTRFDGSAYRRADDIVCRRSVRSRAPRRFGGRRSLASRLGRIRHSDGHARFAPAHRAPHHPRTRPGLSSRRARGPRLRRARRRHARSGDASGWRSNKPTARRSASTPGCCRRRTRAPPPTPRIWSASSSSSSGRAAAGACSSMDRRRLVAALAAHYRDTATGRFDSSLVASRCSTIRSRSCTRANCRPQSAPRRDRSDAISRAAASASTLAAVIERWRR